MRLIVSPRFNLQTDFRKFAESLTEIVNPTAFADFTAYQTTPGNDTLYTLDQNNNWWLSRVDGQVVDLNYRYNKEDGLPHEQIVAARLVLIDWAKPERPFTLSVGDTIKAEPV